MIKLTNEQKSIVDTLVEWFKKPNSQFITLGGYAGTGKTTLISIFRKKLDEINSNYSVAFCSYTGKASRVLETKLKESKSKKPSDTVSTIHSLVYAPLTNDKDEIIGWERKKEVKADLIIVDEASMIDSDIWNDLLSYKIPIIAVGDHGQLPPIKGNFNLMEKPQLKLEEIHRQAKDNPIIQLSELARKEGNIEIGKFGVNIEKIDRTSDDANSRIVDILETSKNNSMILSGFNSTRVKLNKYMRTNHEYFEERPQIGERIICLRNNHEKQIYNGMLGNITSIEEDDEDSYFIQAEMDDGLKYKGSVFAPQFGNKESLNYSNSRSEIGRRDLFDFGYAMTVHKAQGSQANRVVLFEERSSHMDDDTWRKWLYTGITRAESELFLISKR